MSDPMNGRLPPDRSCNQWADLLAFTPEEQLSPDERAALIAHMATCATCTAMRNDYRLLTAYMRRTLSVTPLPHLPDSVLAHMERTASKRLPSCTIKQAGGACLLPRRYALAVIIGLIVLFARFVWPLSFFQTSTDVHAASLSWHQFLMLPQPGATSVHSAAWSPDGEYLAVLWDNSLLQVLDAHTFREVFSKTAGWGYGLAWSPDSQYLASVGREDHTIQILQISTHQYGTRTLTPYLTYTGHTAQIEAIAWSPDGNSIASTSDDHTVQVWDAHTTKWIYTYQDPGSEVTRLFWSSDGKRLVTGDNDNHIQAWDALTGAHLVSYVGHTGSISSVNQFPDGSFYLSTSYDGTVRIWNVSREAPELTVSIHAPIFAAATWWKTRTQGYLALSVGSSIQLWQITEQRGSIRPLAELDTLLLAPHSNIVSPSLSWSPHGEHLIAGASGAILDFRLGA